MKRLLTTVAVGASLGVAMVCCSPIKRGEYTAGTAIVYCEDGFRNILEEEIEVFEYSYPKANIVPFYVSETDAINTMLKDSADLIIINRELNADEKATIKSKWEKNVRQECIAVDAVALITNKDNPLRDLDMDQLKDILSGRISRWNQLALNDTAKIKIVFDNPGSSTVRYMRENYLPAGTKMADNPNAYAQQNNADVFEIVKKDRNALGIISVSWLGHDLQVAKELPLEQRIDSYNNLNDTVRNDLTTEVNILALCNPTEANDFSMAAYKPYQAYIFTGQYPLVRKVYLVSTCYNSSVGHSFYTFVTGTAGQKIIAVTGIAPYHFHQRVVNLQ